MNQGYKSMMSVHDQRFAVVPDENRTLMADTDSDLQALKGAGGADVARRTENVRRVGPNLRILLVDDDSICRLLLETFLARYGKCHVAMNGREAVDAVRAASAKGEHFDLICMDIRMPEMNGRDAVQHVRALEEADSSFRHSGAKIIMTTTVNDNQEMFECFEVLCDAYLVKPIDLGDLLNKMKAFQLVQ